MKAASDEACFDALFKHWWRHNWNPDPVSSAFSPQCEWTHTLACVTESLLSWVCGGLYWYSSAREKSHNPSCSSLLLWKYNSPEKSLLVKWSYGEGRWEKLFQCICCWAPLNQDLPPWVQLSKLSVLLTITRLLPPRADVAWEKLVLSLEAPPASFGAGLQLQASWGQAAGGVGAFCPLCSLMSLTCFGSGVSVLRLNLFLPFWSNSIPQVIKAT